MMNDFHIEVFQKMNQIISRRLRFFPNKNESCEITVKDLANLTDYGIAIYYIDENGRQIVLELQYEDVNLDEDNKIENKLNLNYSNNIIEYLKNDSHIGRSIIVNGEISKDRIGRFRYTKVKVQSDNDLHYDIFLK